MSTRLSRSEREFIVGSYLKGKPVAGYDVIECANGKYRVKAKPFEVESSDESEPEEEPIKQESVKQEPESVKQEESSDEPKPQQIKQLKPKQRMNKQDARQLLKQLNDMFSDDDDEPQSYSQHPRNWNRRRLKFYRTRILVIYFLPRVNHAEL